MRQQIAQAKKVYYKKFWDAMHSFDITGKKKYFVNLFYSGHALSYTSTKLS